MEFVQVNSEYFETYFISTHISIYNYIILSLIDSVVVSEQWFIISMKSRTFN